MLNIHDIKPLVEIPDYSIYLYYFAIISSVFLGLFIIYFLYKFFIDKKNNQLKKHYKYLKNIELKNPKDDAYLITRYGRVLAKDDRSKKLLDDLEEDLQDYKYKKEIPEQFSKETKVKFDNFLESIDV